MKPAKRAGVLYVFGLVALVAHIYLFTDPPTEVFRTVWFYLAPAGVLLMGLVIGWFGYMIIQHVKWIRSFYLFGLNLSFILFLLGLGYIHMSNWRDAQRYGYDVNGRIMLEKAEEEGNKEIVDGFQVLLQSFPRISQVHFHGWLATDTVPDHLRPKDTIKVIYYVYHLGSDTNRCISKIQWDKRQFQLVSINQLPASDTLFGRLSNEYLAWKKERRDSIISLLNTAQKNRHQEHPVSPGTTNK